jgi:hypothetical protein
MTAQRDGFSYWRDDRRYVPMLQRQRTLYAWCLVHYGGDSDEAARTKSEKFYAYEALDAPCRGLVFHDHAWKWAMLHRFGGGYWNNRPELLKPCDEYWQLEESLQSARSS